MATERQEKSPAPDRVKMPDRFEKLDDALAAECVLVLVNLKVAATDQAIDQRQTTDRDGLPGFNGGFPLIRQNQIADLSLMKKCLVRVNPLGVMHGGDFLFEET